MCMDIEKKINLCNLTFCSHANRSQSTNVFRKTLAVHSCGHEKWRVCTMWWCGNQFMHTHYCFVLNIILKSNWTLLSVHTLESLYIFFRLTIAIRPPKENKLCSEDWLLSSGTRHIVYCHLAVWNNCLTVSICAVRTDIYCHAPLFDRMNAGANIYICVDIAKVKTRMFEELWILSIEKWVEVHFAFIYF